MLTLRIYQRDAISALYVYWSDGGGNGVIVIPTGGGKALVIAKLIEELLGDYPDMRIIVVTHSKTLVGQNHAEFMGLLPNAPAGIFSAGLGRKDYRAQVLFAGIQSIANQVPYIGAIDLVIVDEAHAISRNSDTLYGKFFKAVREGNPDSRIVGLTATDYRMDSGRLTEGDDRLFDDVVYEIGIGELIEQGHLTRLTSVKTSAKINLKGIHTRGGDYVPGEMQDAAERIIEEAVAEDVVASEGRQSALFFCAGKDNAEHAAAAVRRHGRTCEALHDGVPEGEQDRIIREFKAGTLWGLSSVNMIYTGANFPRVDFISLLLSTKSPGKLVQALGRGTRNSPGKTECLVADHGKNLSFHGPIDQIKPKEPGEGGDQPRKMCPSDKTDIEGKTGCSELIPISAMVCHCCGYIFPPNEEEKITAAPDMAPVLSTEPPQWYPVVAQTFSAHTGRESGIRSVRVDYKVGFKTVQSYICVEHEGRAKWKADKFWRLHGGETPAPATVDEFLERAGELVRTAEVQIDFKNKEKSRFANDWRPDDAANDNVASANDNEPLGLMDSVLTRLSRGRSPVVAVNAKPLFIDDEIPFMREDR